MSDLVGFSALNNQQKSGIGSFPLRTIEIISIADHFVFSTLKYTNRFGIIKT